MQMIATDNSRVVVGLGLTGLSCARYLAAKQLPFAVVDSREQPPQLDAFREEFPQVSIVTGGISEQSLQGATQLVVSPGVSLEEPAIQQAIEQGIDVCGDVDLFREEVSAPIIAITGSNGKSTVTTLVGEMARHCGKRVAVGGNIGVPVLELLQQPEPDLYVLELSSFQLERAGNLAVEIATVLNMSADHMDRYSNMAAYHRAKHRIFRGCHKAVVNRGDPLSQPLVPDSVEVWTFGMDKPDFRGFGLVVENGEEYLAYQFDTLMPVSELTVAGRHNLENALAALALGKAFGLDIAPMLDVLRGFEGLPHRCQFVARVNGVRYINDSKGTNAGATIAAIEGLVDSAESLVLIAGGQSKGADLAPLGVAVNRHVRVLVAIGEAADELSALAGADVKTIKAASMEDAVQRAAAAAGEGDVVLLSPACASFDMFANYQQRGDQFCAAVHELAGEGAR